MFSIRTTLVVAGFVAMGLTSAAEYLADLAVADPDPFVTVDARHSLPGTVQRFTGKAADLAVSIGLAPWI